MSDFASTVLDAAAAVSGIGACQSDIDLLDDASLQAAMRLVRDLEHATQPMKLWLAAAIARRSDHTLGYDGLARKNGFPTPATFIQSMTGGSLDEATKLARLGAMVVEAADSRDSGSGAGSDNSGSSGSSGSPDDFGGVGSSGDTAIAIAATTGELSLDCADAIRRGLGKPDAAVTGEQLRVEAQKPIAHAQTATLLGSSTPEALLRLARQARARLDQAAIARGEKERAALRYVRRWSRDGLSGGSWCLPDEDGGADIDTALKLLLASTTGGPRFPHTDADGNPLDKTPGQSALDDTRTAEQILADGFATIVLNGLGVDPAVIPGSRRVPVRVMVPAEVIANKIETDEEGLALLEANLSPVSLGKLEEWLCDAGTVDVIFHGDGTIDVGREQRLFTPKQRTALAVSQCGCMFPGCNKPPSWTEAHHIDYWARDGGRTDIENGVLLCRYHHMFVHSGGWRITRNNHEFWLIPPPSIDPAQTPIPMPSKNPLMLAMRVALESPVPAKPKATALTL